MQGSAPSSDGLSLVEAIVYGLIQGITEFLPISSSDHLVVVAHRAGLGALPPHIELSFYVLLHGATLIAIGIAFHNEIAALHWRSKPWHCIAISILSAGIVGLLGKNTLLSRAATSNSSAFSTFLPRPCSS